MKVIDILNKRANGEEVPKKIKYADDIYVLNNYTDAIERLYVWEQDNDIGWFEREYFTLHSEVEVIEDKPEEEEIKELPPLEYIKFNIEQSVDDISNTITYMSTTVTTDLDTELLALIINRLIKEVEDLKHRLEITDKELEDHKKDLFSHNGSSIKLTTGLDDGGVTISKVSDFGISESEARKMVDNILNF